MNKSTFALVASLVAVVIAAYMGLNPQVQKSQFGIDAGPTHYNAQEFVGGTVLGLVNSTSTTDTAYTMVAADLANARQGAFYDTYIHMKTNSVGTTTNTFPASSTLSYVLPKAGQRTSICFTVATSTGGAGMILAEGTGWDFVNASTTILNTALNAQVTSNNGTLARTILGGTASCGMIVRERAVSSSPGFVDSTSTTPGNFMLILNTTYPSQ